MLLTAHSFEMGELLTQEARGVALEQISYQCGAKAWRGTDKDMNMIFIRIHCQQRQSVLLTTLGDESFCLFLYLTCQDRTAVLWYPH
jgi:hypothetical protein